MEQALVAIWHEVLGLEQVSVEDSFFDLGGDSIRAVRLVGALRAAGFDFSIRDVFEHRTVAELALQVPDFTGGASLIRTVEPFELIGAEDRAKLPADVVDAYPMSQVQTGMIVEMLTDTERHTYHNLTSFRVRDEHPFDPAIFHEAARAVVERHEMLRTSMDLTGYSQPLQLVHAAAEVPIALHDLRGLTEAGQLERFLAFVADERADLFEPERAPMMRFSVHLESDAAWRLSFTFHHAITEGWGYHALLMEVFEVYSALRDGREPEPFEQPAVRYADFIAAEQAALADPESEAFWKRIVDTHVPLVLPVGLGDESGPAETLRVPVPYADLEDGLRALAAAADSSLKSVLLAAHLKVMSELTNESAFHTGMVYHGRLEAPGSDRVMGMHLNTLPFPLQRGARTWRELVAQVYAQETAIWEHRRYPLPAIQRAAGGNQRLLNVLFEYLDFHHLDSTVVDTDGGYSDAPTEFGINIAATGGNILLRASTRALGREGAERLGAMYRSVLEAMAADAGGDALVSRLPGAERARVLSAWALSEDADRGPQSTLDLFERQAELTPDAVAVVAPDGSLTYREVEERANRIAHHLLAQDVRPDTLVGVCLARGVHLVPTLLGVWKAGAAYLPLDPTLPTERLGIMLRQSGTSLVVTTADRLPVLSAVHQGGYVLADEDAFLIAARPAVRPERTADLDRLAYVIYTSGSTGMPKGVMVHHRGLVNYLVWTLGVYASHGDGGAPLFSSISFDLGIPDLFSPVLCGQTVYLLKDGINTADLGRELMAGAPYAFVKLTPGHLDLLTHQLTADEAKRLAGVVIAAGDNFPTSLAARWQELAGPDGTKVASEYGPTEITIGNSGELLERLPGAELIPLGPPIPNTSMYVLTDTLEPVAVGVPGEVYIGGTGLARGYLGRPDLTAERFLPDPYGKPGARLYRTGDLGRWLPDGSLDFLGRIDNQVKIRGYRIELGEIEARLRRHPAVEDTVVTVREPQPGNRRLVGYVVTADGHGLDPDALRAHLAAALPEYMVPSAFMAIDKVPLTANGKVDTRALPAPDRGSLADGDLVAPRTPVEEALVAIWREVLGLDEVSVKDSFFDLGGDSIRAVRLVGALRAAGFDLSIRDVFEHRTVAEMALRVPDAVGGASLVRSVEPFELIGAEDRAALPADVVDAYPLSLVQTGMIVEMLTDAEQRTYHNLASYRIRDERPFEAEAFRTAVRLAVARHDVLRTSVHLETYSEPMQLVHAGAELKVAVEDVRGLDAAAQFQALLAFAEREQAELFDLASAPLTRITVFLEADDAWRLVFTHCHAVTDGWSLNTLLGELVADYRTLVDGAVPVQEALPVRYADFVAAELAALAGGEDEAFWLDVVGTHVPFALPEGWGDPAAAREPVEAAVPLAGLEPGLRALAQQTGVSLKSVLHAAHLKALSMLTAEPAFYTGLVAHGRPAVPGSEQVLGMHLNTLPFPMDRTARTWRELVAQVFARETEFWAHRHFPLPAIQRASGSSRGLLNAVFDFHDFHQVDTDRVDTGASLSQASTEFDLLVVVSGGFVNLRSDTDVLTRAEADRLASLYRTVLEAMAADPDGDARLAYLPAGELELLTGSWAAAQEAPVDTTVHEVFERQVAATPDAVAVVSDGVELSYAEVNERANRLAHHLRSLGAGPERLVGLSLERGPDLLPALLGVLKSGAAYVPLDPSNPQDRLDYILADTAAPIVVTQRSLAERFAGFGGELAVLDDEATAGALAAAPTGNPAVLAGPDSVIYVIYTSGSTGKPKGVCLSHGNVVRLFTTTREQFRFGPEDVWTLFHSYAFDWSVWEMWGALLHGGRIVVVPAAVSRAPGEFLDLLVEHRVTVLCQTPTAFRTLAQLAGAGDARVDGLSLRTVIFGGERLDMGELAPWAARVGVDRTALVNMYGITETTVHTTHHLVSEEDLAHASASPIGAALGDLRIYLLDAQGELAPIGVPGEIHVGGPGVSRGYLGRPELTAERFVPDRFAGDGSRLYRSGDLARRLADGSLEFLGRIDTQVKIRGFRIELGEIQARLREHTAVEDVVVTVREAADGEKSLVAYIVPAGGAEPDVAALRGHLAAGLPDYMVPSAFVAIERIPLTTNGKLDTRALPAPDRESYAGAELVAPRTPVEARMAAVWQDVLGLEAIGVEDSFFDLGGDSIRAVRLVGALRAAGFDLSIRDVFEHRTVAELARRVPESVDGSSLIETVAPFALIGEQDRAKLPAGVVDAYPLSQVQTGMIVEMLTDTEQHTYHNLTSFRVRDERPFDLALFRAAARTVAGRHDTLRTSVDLTGYAKPLQLVHGDVEVPIALHDVRGLPEAEQLRLGREFVEAERVTLFDPETAPLIRFSVHLESDEAWRLTFTFHHAITEGWSYNTLLMELIEVYTALHDGREPEPFEAPSVRYADFIAAEQAALADPATEAYWLEVVDEHAPFDLPIGWGDEGARTADGDRHAQVRVPIRDLEDGLRDLAGTTGASLKSVLLAAHLKVMSMLTTEEAFHTGVVYHGRLEAPGGDRVMGMHLNTLPFPLRRGARTWRELVGQVFARETENWAHRRYPLPAVQRAAGGKQRLLNVLFEFLDFHQVDRESVDTGANFTFSVNEFMLNVVVIAGHVTINSSDVTVIGRDSLDRLGAMYRMVLEAMAADTEGDASARYLPETERRRLLDGAAAEPVQTETLTRELFEQQAARTPDAVAVVADGQEVGYAQLDASANRIAQRLRALGAGPDAPVGVLLPRGPKLVSTLLAVWKAGAAYLPIDPLLPADRIGYMLADAGAALLVSESGPADRLAGSFEGTRLLLDREVLPAAAPAPARVVSRDDLAYVIYTSGSTGRPKGVMVSHGSLFNLLCSMRDDAALGLPGSWLAATSISFDISALEIHLPLITGGRIVLASDGAAKSPAALLELVAEHRVSHLQATPSGWRLLLAAGLDLPGVTALTGGEALPVSLAQELRGRVGRLVNVYGPTETTIWSSFWEVPPAPKAVSVGRPVAETQLYVLDAGLELVPMGVTGELFIGGDGLARGYLGRPELTAEKFLPDPFGPPGARLYRTGDLARRLPDGSLECLGRADSQIKLRGYRIELGEIETVIADLPGVREAVVVLWEDPAGEKLLVAYTVAAEGGAADAAALRAGVAATLPEYMVPSAFVALDALPLNSAGKVNRRALPAPEREAFAAGRRFVAPRTPAEERIAAVWQDVLGVAEVGVEDGFFDLGGDSIRAVQLVGSLRAAGYDLAIGDVFEHRTVAELAALVPDSAGGTSLIRTVEPFELIGDLDRAKLPAGVVDAYPLSQVQTGMLIEMLADDEQRLYHNLTSHLIPDTRPFSEDAFWQAVRTLVARHEILRTSMDLTGYAQPMQLVHATAEIPLSVSDLRDLSPEAQRSVARAFAAAERDTPFDPAVPPMLRLAVHVESDAAWRLTITLSHAVLEGWSMTTLLVELLDVYRRLLDGEPVEEPEAPAVRYADFIAAELESLADEGDRAFWQGVIDENAPVLLPGSWARGEGESGDVAVQVPYEDLADGLRALATATRSSLKSVLLAAHLKVMSGIGNEPAFHTGVVYHGRLEAPGGDRVMGMHLNTLPFPMVRGARTWRELVEQVFAQETGIWAHRRYPMPAVQRASGSSERLLDVLFEYQNFAQLESAVDTRGGVASGGNEFALNVIATTGRINLWGSGSAIGAEAAEALGRMYRSVLEAMAADADGDARGSHLPADQRTRVLTDWALGEAVERGGLATVDLIERQAELTPDAVAVAAPDGSLTYRELDERANRIAHHLLAQGVQPDTLVGVCLARGLDLVPVLLGVWKAGAGYLPLDPSLPTERLGIMLAHTGTRLVVTDLGHRPLLDGVHHGDVVLVDGDRAVLDALPAVRPERTTDLDRLAYVIYTSGSTGVPKGVMIHHRGLANYLLWTLDAYAAHGDGGAPLFSSISFDLGIPDLFSPLLCGQVVRLLKDGIDTADLGRELMSGAPYAFVKLTPGHLDLLTHQLTADEASKLAGVVIAAGDTFPTSLAARWQELAGAAGTKVASEYGPTEITIGNSGQLIAQLPGAELIPLGGPIPNTSMYVLTEALEPVAVGVPGEVYIGGDGLARGYLGRPDLTADRFLPDPFGAPGARLYRTGDLARWLPDGSLDFLGRIDNQVKIRGYRIELGEIEARLREHAGVKDAVVTVRESQAGGKAVIGYLVPAGEQEPAASELRAHLAAVLPEYMVPSAFMAIEKIPLTANGKVDTRSLPAPDRDLLAGTARVAPRTPVEARMAAVWQDVLGLDEVGVEDGFFDLGGDSIRAVRLVGALRAAGFDLSIRDVFEHRTVAGLAGLVPAEAAETSLIRAVEPFALIGEQDRAKLPEGLVDAYPLSQVQIGMLVEMLADGERRNYVDVSFYRVPDPRPFSLAAFREAVRTVVARHEILRTSAWLTGYSRPMQLVHANVDVPIGLHDLRGLDPDDQYRAGVEFEARERADLFDIATAPLLRFNVLLESDEVWRLSFTHCHAVTEGWSMHSMLMELLGVYGRILDGEPVEEPEAPAVRYADFIAAELESLADEGDRAFWQTLVDGHAPMVLPGSWGRGGGAKVNVGSQVPFDDLEERLRALASATGSSLKSVLLAAHLKVMGELTTEPAFHSGVVYHGRLEAPGGDRVMGMHLNTLPFPIRRGARTWRELVEQVFAQDTEIWSHRRYPMPAIQRASGSNQRLVSVLFEFLDFHQVDGEQVDVSAEIHVAPNEFAVNVAAIDGRIEVISTTDVLTRAEADLLGRMYRSVLEAMAADADGDALGSCLPAEDRERVLTHWALGGTAERGGLATVDLIERQAALTPHALAVVAPGGSLTYREVDERSNRIAHHLLAQGVRPDTLVGVCLERGLDLVPVLLGVWKAGAGYLPLDPSLPVERLGAMLAQSGTSLVVTTGERVPALSAVHGGGYVLVDEDAAAIAARPATAVERTTDLDRLAYVIYTSGSTGVPKGVMIHHRGLANYLLWTLDAYAAHGDGGAPLFSSISFDLGIPDLFSPLLCGQVVRLLKDGIDTADLGRELMSGAPYAFVKLTPGHLDLLTHQLTADEASKLAGVVIAAGDTFPTSLAARWQELAGAAGTKVASEYGPTEITIGNSGQLIAQLPGAELIPLGGPIPNTSMYVLTEALEPVAVGVPGEVYIGGDGLARGYLGRPDLTADRFLPDPFGAPGARLYRTGDLARWLPDGSLDFLGRIDNQVKIRGYRIELGEIEARLRRHDAVQDAVVAVREPQPGNRRLVGYVVTADGHALDANALRAHLAGALPEYMVPTAFVAIEKIPLTANGKVDTRSLPLPDRGALAESEVVAPRTPVEETLAAIWREVLGVEQVSVEDSFFELGGDSIRAVKVLAAGREAGLSALAVWMIYQANSLAELAALIEEAGGEESSGDAVEPTPAQLRLLEQGGAGADTVRLSVALEPDHEVLEQALQAVVAHHDALRLRIGADGRASVARPGDAPLLRVVDLGALPVAERSAAVEAAVGAVREGLDPEHGPLLGATLLHFGNGQPDELRIAADRLAVDRATWPILLTDLNAAYEQRADGVPVVLPRGPVDLARWTGGLGALAASPEVLDQADYWLNRVPGADLPRDHADGPAVPTHATDETVTVTLSAERTAALLAGGQAEAVLLATLGRAVTTWSGGDRIEVDLAADPRQDPEHRAQLDRLAGPLGDVHPLALRVPRNRELPALVRGVVQQLRSVPSPAAGYGLLRYLAADLDLRAELAEPGAAQLGFTLDLDGAVRVERERTPLVFVPDHLAVAADPQAPRAHLLDVHAHLSGGQLYLRWTHSAAVHEAATVQRLAQDQLDLLAALLDGDGDGTGGADGDGGSGGNGGGNGGGGTGRPSGRGSGPAAGRPARTAAPTREALLEVMGRHGIPGAQLAVIRGGEVVSVEGYGSTEAGGGAPVTPETLFAAGSLSKHVTTFAVLRLVGAGRLDLDGDINRHLTSWRVPDDGGAPITPRLLLSNVAGLAPYLPPRDFERGEELPTVLDLLDGRPPARTPAVRRECPPGEVFRQNPYNYCILQQAMADMLKQPFSEVMWELVFEPLGMAASSFDPVFPETTGLAFAHAHDASGAAVPGGYHVYPEAAAGGLWSTAGDLARLAAEVRAGYLGTPGALVPRDLARQMLTPQSDRPYGWSTVIDNTGADLEFGHGGQAFGYQAMSGLRVHSGDGAVVLTNAATGRELVKHLIATVWSNQDRLAALWQRAIDEAVAREQRANGATQEAGSRT
ncbi:amino acid adenylation domain-containing protein [Kitasatospora sp. NPDC054939]